MFRLSQLSWYLGLTGVVFSGALNGFVLYESLGYTQIQVLKNEISHYHMITASDVTTISYPKVAIKPDMVTTNLIGRVSKEDVPPNEPVLASELSSKGSLANVIQNLYFKYPNLSFTQIMIPDTALNETIQPDQHVSFVVNGIVYPDVWVLGISNNKNVVTNFGSQITSAINNFANTSISSSSGSNTNNTVSSNNTLQVIVGANWSTIQGLMSSQNAQVVLGNNPNNTTVPTNGSQSYTFGSPPVSQNSVQSSNNTPNGLSTSSNSSSNGLINYNALPKHLPPSSKTLISNSKNKKK